MEKATIPARDILLNRAGLLKTSIEFNNSQIAMINAAVQLIEEKKAFITVRVLNSDTFRDVLELPLVNDFLNIEGLKNRLQQDRDGCSRLRVSWETELHMINRQLAAMGSGKGQGVQ